MSVQPVISFERVTHYYGKKLALSDVSWELMPGRICGLLGRNGAGKTTTINILNAFLTPQSGRCLLLGEDSGSLSNSAKARIGYLIEGHVQYGFLDVDQLERFYAPFYPAWKSSIYRHLVSKLDIQPGQKVATMSCGQRSQVALGLILAQQPDLIILDDFSMGLDPGYRRLFVEVLKDFAVDGKRSILLTSHIIQDLEGLVDDVLIYQKGSLRLSRTTRELMEGFRQFHFEVPAGLRLEPFFDESRLTRLEINARHGLLSGFMSEEQASGLLRGLGCVSVRCTERETTLEDIFISITGKY